MKRVYLLAGTCVLMAVSPFARGQGIWPSTLNATGGYTYIAGNEYEWSVGEMALVNTFTTSSVVVTQGILQTRFGVTEVPSLTNLGDYLQVYPNPASTILNVQYTADKEGLLSLRLLDMTGKLVTEQKVDVKPGTTAQKLDISALAVATYMLEVYMTPTHGKTEATAYKIQKLQ